MMISSLLIQVSAAAVLVFAAAIVLFQGVGRRDLTQNMERVLHGEEHVHRKLSLQGALLGLVRQVGTFVQRFSIFSARDIAELDRAARSAGYAPETAVPVVIGGKLFLMVGCPVIAYVLTRHLTMPWPIVYTCAGVAAGIFGPNAVIAYARKQRLRALRLGLSDALDLLVVCTEAGLGLETAIDRVATEMKYSNFRVAQEFETLSQDLRLSSDRGAALMRMGERTGLETFQRLTMTLAQTLRYGTPLGQALRLLAIEMRNDRMMALEEKAARLPTLMMIPLAIFILPCLFIVVAGPAALRVMAMAGN